MLNFQFTSLSLQSQYNLQLKVIKLENQRSHVHPIAQLMVKGSDRLCKVVELSIQCCGKLYLIKKTNSENTLKVGVLNVEFALKLRIYRS